MANTSQLSTPDEQLISKIRLPKMKQVTHFQKFLHPKCLPICLDYLDLIENTWHRRWQTQMYTLVSIWEGAHLRHLTISRYQQKNPHAGNFFFRPECQIMKQVGQPP